MQSQLHVVQVRSSRGAYIFPQQLCHSKSVTRRQNRRLFCTVEDSFAAPQIPDEIVVNQQNNNELDTYGNKYQPVKLGPPQQFYTNYAIYKGKAALQISVISPTWEATKNYEGEYIKKEGVMCLQFAASVGTRTYDWERKVVFSLSVTELGQIMDPPEGSETYSFYHDPNMSTSKRGIVTKQLRIQQYENKSGYYVSVLQNSKGSQSQNIGVPVSNAEYNVISTLAKSIIPHLLGFDRYYSK